MLALAVRFPLVIPKVQILCFPQVAFLGFN